MAVMTVAPKENPGFMRQLGIALQRRILKTVTGKEFTIYNAPTIAQSKYGLMDKQGDVKEMLKAFKSVVFACIHVRAKEVATRGIFVAREKKAQNEFEDLPLDHPLAELLENPNPYFSRFVLWYLTICYLDITGNSYWWAARDKLGVPRALWPIPSQNVRIVPGVPSRGEQIIKGYNIIWDGKQEVYVEQEEIIHLKHPDPNNPYYYGGSLVMRAGYEADIHHFLLSYQREFLANDAVPALLLMFKQVMDKDVRAAFEEQWLTRFQRKPGKVGYLEGEATAVELGSRSELGYLNSMNVNTANIRAVFGVPESKLMSSEHISARATTQTMDYTFHSETIDPLLTMLGEQMTIDLARPFYDDRIVIHHRSTIPDDLKTSSDLDKNDIDMGKMSINEVRAKHGLEPVPGGDEILVPINRVPLSSVSGESGLAPADTGTVASLRRRRLPPVGKKLLNLGAITETQKVARWKAHDRFRMRYEVKLTRKIKAYFNRIRDEVLTHVRSRKSVKSDDVQIDVNQLMFDVSVWAEILSPIVRQEMLSIIQASFDEFIRQYEIEDVVYAPNSPGVQLAIRRIVEKTRTVPQSLYDDLHTELSEGIRLNESVDQLATRVSRFFQGTVDYRSVRIARTVSNYAVNQGNALAAKNSGLFTNKMWLTMRDERVRDLHIPIDGTVLSLEEKFELANGDQLDVPGDPESTQAESVVNCRCSVLFGKD